jgi:hypothetical protein
MNFITFKTFFEQITNAAITQGANNSNSSHIRDNRVAGGANATGLRTGTKNHPGATNTVAQSNINTQSQTKNKIDKIAQNPAAQEVLGDMDLQEIQNTHGIDLNNMQDNQPLQINSKTNAAVVKSVDATGKPVYKLMHYKPVQ